MEPVSQPSAAGHPETDAPQSGAPPLPASARSTPHGSLETEPDTAIPSTNSFHSLLEAAVAEAPPVAPQAVAPRVDTPADSPRHKAASDTPVDSDMQVAAPLRAGSVIDGYTLL